MAALCTSHSLSRSLWEASSLLQCSPLPWPRRVQLPAAQRQGPSSTGWVSWVVGGLGSVRVKAYPPGVGVLGEHHPETPASSKEELEAAQNHTQDALRLGTGPCPRCGQQKKRQPFRKKEKKRKMRENRDGDGGSSLDKETQEYTWALGVGVTSELTPGDFGAQAKGQEGARTGHLVGEWLLREAPESWRGHER